MQKHERARESRIRRKLLQNGYRIMKSRQRNHAPNLNNFGDYMVIDAATCHTVLGRRFEATPDDIEARSTRP